MPIQEEARKGIIEICESHKNEPSPLMVVLEEIQKKYGYIPLEAQEVVSKEMNIPVAEIYGVVTFYNFFSLTPKGKYVIGVCLGTACYVKASQAVIDKFATVLGIKPGETTEDGLFTIEAIRCMGACALAPAVSVNGKVYPMLGVDGVVKVIDEYRQKEAALEAEEEA
ncbi:MAG: NAD(P)H-dependent oxidoreductase subunit E [Bacilli bacterium]|nr:NAD(P)H-dependent oxidoreductase subunit E [Bacilli bacterium]